MKRNEKPMLLDDQAQLIKELAREKGLQANYFFVTTFERYQTQLKILEDLKKSLDEEGMLVTKEYVKGRKNLYTNPAVSDYNRTTDSANKTVSTLMRIIKGFGANDDDNEKDPLLDAING